MIVTPGYFRTLVFGLPIDEGRFAVRAFNCASPARARLARAVQPRQLRPVHRRDREEPPVYVVHRRGPRDRRAPPVVRTRHSEAPTLLAHPHDRWLRVLPRILPNRGDGQTAADAGEG